MVAPVPAFRMEGIAPSDAPASYTGPLDIVGGAVIAYGQRALSSAKRGSALYTIRRDSDDTTQSFNSDATDGSAPVAAISSFIGGGNGFGSLWNDQSGNAHHAVQATSANQPSWTASAFGGRPGLTWGTVSELVTSETVSLASGECTIFAVLQMITADADLFVLKDATNGSYMIFGPFSSTSTPDGVFIDTFDGDSNNEAGVFCRPWSTNPIGLPAIIETACVFGSSDILLNGAAQTLDHSEDSVGPVGPMSGTIGVFNPDDGTVSSQLIGVELIMYNSVLSDADRLAIRQNIAAYYGITLS